METPGSSGVPQVTPAFVLTGGATADGVRVNSVLSLADKGARVDLAVWRADGSGGTTLVGEHVADHDAIVRHTVSGRQPNTAYFARLVYQGDLVGERVRFKTLPTAGRSWTRKIAVVSCQSNVSNPTVTDLAWRDVIGWRPDDLWHLGDWGYWGRLIPVDATYKRDLAHYRSCMRDQPTIEAQSSWPTSTWSRSPTTSCRRTATHPAASTTLRRASGSSSLSRSCSRCASTATPGSLGAGATTRSTSARPSG